MVQDTPAPPARWLDLRPIALISLSLALVASTAIAAGTWKHVRTAPPQRNIRITGSAKKRIVSDLIEWNATVVAHANDRTAAYKELRGEVVKTIALLKKLGVREDEIFPQSASFRELFEQQTTEVGQSRVTKQVSRGFETSEVIHVRSTDVARIEKVSRQVTDLLEEGVSITSDAPAYFYTKLGELKVEMLAAAGRDARARAENILKSAGGADIGKLLGADMGIININPANSTQTSEEGHNDTTSLEKDIITIVHADYELE